MSDHLRDKVVLITGAASGFGRELAGMAGRRGARIVAVDLPGDALLRVESALRAEGIEILGVEADVTDRGQMRAMAAAAVARFGGIDVLVNNAGTMPLAFFADHAAAAEAWDRCIDVNLKGVLHGIAAVHDAMIARGRGHVVNVSSIYGNHPNAGSGVYAATKAAVNVLSETLRIESQGRIKVTTIRPTGVPTTGLGQSVVNGGAIVGILGHHAGSFMANIAGYFAGTLDPEQMDPESIRYWAIRPEELARQILYAIDQPWGVSIADITVRASGEEFVL
ncbi:SDR family oxidoreductase [Myxococcota bacterium]|nr:SDR family oxidoreductase [Myxococcota bacterium]